jgi:hypothetical protein
VRTHKGSHPGEDMNCFTHGEAAAVGVCGQCGRSVCRSCAIDLGFRLVCSEGCASLARNSHALVVSAERAWGVGEEKPKVPVPVIMCGLLGAIFLCFALYNLLIVQRNDWFGVAVGIAFVALAFLYYQRSRQFWRSASR